MIGSKPPPFDIRSRRDAAGHERAVPPVLAWGRLGHRVISRLAEQHLRIVIDTEE
jgi:hypothetical protein